MKTANSSQYTNYSGIHLFNESGLSLPINKKQIQSIVKQVESEEACRCLWIEVVFVDEAGIIQINREHLERDYITDIITFRYDEDTANQAVEGTLYCCAPRIQEQALKLNQPIEKEFKRIIIHGLLHLAGYKDKTPSQKKTMTQKEDFYLAKTS